MSMTGAWRSQIGQVTATTATMSNEAPSTIVSPNLSAPRARAGRWDPQYSSHDRTIRVSWPQSAITPRNDMELKMMASEPKAAASMWRADSANMANPRIEPVNLMPSAVALPRSTSLAKRNRARSLAAP